jgi:hypothetical protein
MAGRVEGKVVDQAWAGGRPAERPGVGGVDGDVEQQRVAEQTEPCAAVGSGWAAMRPFRPRERLAAVASSVIIGLCALAPRW